MVTWAMGNRVEVNLAGERMTLPIPGAWRRDNKAAKPLAPGDIVRLCEDGSGWRIFKQVERRNEFTRRQPGHKPMPQTIAANLDGVIIVASAHQPKTPLGLVDRLQIAATLGGCRTMLLVNKMDLVSDDTCAEWSRVYEGAVEWLIPMSALTGEGLEVLQRKIGQGVYLLAGSSGVGKTTLINRLLPGIKAHTREVSEVTGKGKHATSVATVYRMDEKLHLIDSPGLRECEPWGMTSRNLADVFAELCRVSDPCKFGNCLHLTESGCAVKAAVEEKVIAPERYNNYQKMAKALQAAPTQW